MYKLNKDMEGNISSVTKTDGSNLTLCIPLYAPDNTDYQTFKKEVLAGAELQDADGNVMTQEQANQFVASLP